MNEIEKSKMEHWIYARFDGSWWLARDGQKHMATEAYEVITENVIEQVNAQQFKMTPIMDVRPVPVVNGDLKMYLPHDQMLFNRLSDLDPADQARLWRLIELGRQKRTAMRLKESNIQLPTAEQKSRLLA